MADMTNASVARVDVPDSNSSGTSNNNKGGEGEKRDNDGKDKSKNKPTHDEKKDDKQAKANEKADDPVKGKTDDINEDKDEDGDEKNKDGKGAKAAEAATASTAANVVAPVAAGAAAVTGIQALVASFAAMIQSIFSAIWSALCAVGSFIANLATTAITALATALAIPVTIAAIAVFGVVGAGAIFIGGVAATVFMSDDIAKSDQVVVKEEEPCVVSEYKSAVEQDGAAMDGDTERTAYTVYSVFYTLFTDLGASNDQANNMVAGMLANFEHESGIDPTAVEDISGEKYTVGEKKKAALSNFNTYSENVTNVNQYYYAKDGKAYCGLGMPQYTAEAAKSILAMADTLEDKEWYDLELQLAVMLSDNGYQGKTPEGDWIYGTDWFKDWISRSSSSTAADCAEYYRKYYERGGADSSASRQEAAGKYLVTIADWEKTGGPDESISDSIIDMAGTVILEAISNARDKEVSNCLGDSGKKAAFTGVTASSFVTSGPAPADKVIYHPDINGDYCDPSVNKIDYANYMGLILDELLDSEGNVKEGYLGCGLWGEKSGVQLTKEGFSVPTSSKWRGQCVTWSCSRIISYIHAKYGVKISISRFGDGADPARDRELLGSKNCIVDIPTHDCVFSWIGGKYGHTGYVEYVDKNGVIVTSECNLGSTGNFFVCVYPPTVYNSPDRKFIFFDLDKVYEDLKDSGSTTWERGPTG